MGHATTRKRRGSAKKKSGGGMSAVAQQLYELASKPLTVESCSKAERIAESISDTKKRHRAYDFVQKYMWDRLPATKPAPSRGVATRHATRPAARHATKAAPRSGRASPIDEFGHAYGEYLQDPKPLNLAKAQAMYIQAMEGGETSRALYDWAQEIGNRVLMDTWIEERGNYWQPGGKR